MKQKIPSTRWLAGKKANKNGKEFEQVIIRYCNREGIAIKKTDPPMRTDGHGKFWREKSGVDFILGHQSIAVFLDAKSLDSDRITHSTLKPHQLQDLSYWQSNGFTSGLIVWFREVDIVSFIPISDLLKLNPGQSIKVDQTIKLGTYLGFELGRLFSMTWETKKCVHCQRAI